MIGDSGFNGESYVITKEVLRVCVSFIVPLLRGNTVTKTIHIKEKI